MASQTKSEPILPLKDSRPGYPSEDYFHTYPRVEVQCPIDGNYLFDTGYPENGNFTCLHVELNTGVKVVIL